MVRLAVISALAWAAGLVAASPSPAPIVAVRTTNYPGTSDEFTIQAVWRRLAALAHHKRENIFKNSTSLDKSWNDATLFSYTYAPNTSSMEGLEAELSIEVTCVTCYFKAGATAEMTINGEFDLGATIGNFTEQLGDELHNLTKTAVKSVPTIAENFWSEVGDLFDEDEFEIEDLISLDGVEIDTDIDIDLPPFPEVLMLFQIDFLDLYMEFDTTIAASTTLTIPLYKSQSALGISAGEGMEIGLFVTMDLILSVEGEISLRSGFHLLLDDPVGFKIALFSSDVSGIIFNGGKFEFLPVTILSGNVALKAILRVGMHAGFSISSEGLIPGVTPVGKKIREAATFKAGVEFGVFATVAEFLTNITGGAELAAQEDGCALKIVEEYTLALGAAAGATVAIGDHTWGPQPNMTIPIFYTTLADICAVSVTPTPATTTAQLTARQQDQPDPNLVTQTLTTEVRYTGVACASPDLAPCPASLHTTTIHTTTKTLVTAVPPGVEATFPPSTALTVGSTIPFGKQVNELAATSGVPVSYVPPPPPTTTSTAEGGGGDGVGGGGDVLDDIGEVFRGETGGVSNKLIIGLSVGLGVPVLIALISGLVYWMKRVRYAPVPKSDTAIEYTGGYDSPMAAERERESMIKKTPAVAVGEVRN